MPTKSQTKREIKYTDPRRTAEKHKAGYERTAVRLPEGAKQFIADKPGNYNLDIGPYIAGKNNPEADEGMVHWERTYWSHWNVGANNGVYVCPAKEAGKKCPICEWRAKESQKADHDEELVKKLKPKQRQLFNVFDLDNPDNGWQIWDLSYYNFGELLEDRILSREKWQKFHHLSGGYTLNVRIGKEKGDGGRDYLATKSIDFEPRDEDLPEETLDETHCLDDLIILEPYDKLKKIFLQTGDEEDEGNEEDDEEKPTRRRGRASAKSDDDDDEEEKPSRRRAVKDEDEDEEEKPRSRRKPTRKEDEDEEAEAEAKPSRRRRATKEDDDGDDDEEEAKPSRRRSSKTEDDEDDDKPAARRSRRQPKEDAEDDEDDKPKSRRAPAKSAKAKDDDDDEDWGDDDEEEKPSRRRSSRAAKEEDDEDEEEEEKPSRSRRARR